MAISLSSSTPSEGQTGWFLNKSLELVFNKAIASASLTNTIFSLLDIDSSTRVPITITAGYANSSKVILVPSTTLKENTQYRVIILGTSDGLGYALTAQDEEVLDTTIHFEFTTGETVYKIDSTIEKEAASLSLEGDLFLPTNVKALGYDFTLSKVRPKNNTHGIDPSITGDNLIRFTFSKALYSGSVDYSEWATVSLFPLLNDTSYLAQSGVLGDGTIPDYSVSVNGTDLLFTFSGALPNNLGVQIELSNEILSVDGDEFGGNTLYSVNTALFPEVYGIQTIKREVREIVDTFTEDYIGALLFKNTIWLWEKVGRTYPLDAMPFAAKQYIAYSTILDLMEDREYYKFVVAGTRRQLGDLGVSVDNLIGRTAMKVAKYQKEKEDAFESLVAGWQFKVGRNSTSFDNVAETVNRLWYDVNGRYTESRYVYRQEASPSANTFINRRAKTTNPEW